MPQMEKINDAMSQLRARRSRRNALLHGVRRGHGGRAASRSGRLPRLRRPLEAGHEVLRKLRGLRGAAPGRRPGPGMGRPAALAPGRVRRAGLSSRAACRVSAAGPATHAGRRASDAPAAGISGTVSSCCSARARLASGASGSGAPADTAGTSTLRRLPALRASSSHRASAHRPGRGQNRGHCGRARDPGCGRLLRLPVFLLETRPRGDGRKAGASAACHLGRRESCDSTSGRPDARRHPAGATAATGGSSGW
jgi:hypothetical protein